ncbi:MAG: 3-phosphoshikimate 1-carboxyvinyltransferase [Anaerolineales bacterium]|nr:3-phosphoshikimate 1-carboxyvinyltransferase [Anaerolineales bacterium]
MNQRQTLKSKKIKPISGPLHSRVHIPGSKSLTNRALFIAALADGSTSINNALFSEDTYYFANALQTLGFNVSLAPEKSRMMIIGLGGHIPAQHAELFIGNAGTAARFLTAFLTLGAGNFSIDGDARMRKRPIGDLVDSLNQLGAQVRTQNNQETLQHLPLSLRAAGLAGGKTTLAGDISSQYLSALLMVAPCAKNPVEIEITTELYSKPYVDMTIAIMSDFGVSVQREGYKKFTIQPGSFQPRSHYAIETDASAASYFFAAAAVCGGTVRVENVSRRSVQGDIRFLDLLKEMGCEVVQSEDCIEVSGPSRISGVDADMSDISDTAQTLAVVAPFATSPTRIRGIGSARFKETDRISATCTELQKIGVRVDEHKDGMTIYPCPEFRAANVQTYNDHRMAMAFSLIGLRVPGIVIEDPGCVSKTFPTFFDVLDTLR